MYDDVLPNAGMAQWSKCKQSFYKDIWTDTTLILGFKNGQNFDFQTLSELEFSQKGLFRLEALYVVGGYFTLELPKVQY